MALDPTTYAVQQQDWLIFNIFILDTLIWSGAQKT